MGRHSKRGDDDAQAKVTAAPAGKTDDIDRALAEPGRIVPNDPRPGPASTAGVDIGGGAGRHRRGLTLAIGGALVVLLTAVALTTALRSGDDGRANATPSSVSSAAAARPCSEQTRILVAPADGEMWQSVLNAYAQATQVACQPIVLADLPADPAAAGAALADADGWIADDLLSLAQLPSTIVPTRTDVIARTPLVLVSGGAVEDIAQLRNPPAPLSVTVASPLASAASALGLNALTMALTGQPLQIAGSFFAPTDSDQRMMAATMSMHVVQDITQTLSAPIARDAVVLATEAAAWRDADSAVAAPAVLYLQDGAAQLQAPLVQLRASAAIDALRDFLGGARGTAALTASGLRPADGDLAPTPRGAVVPTSQLPPVPAIDSAQLQERIGLFTMLTTPVSVTAAIDMSGSMKDPMPGAPSGLAKIDLIRGIIGTLFQNAPPGGRSGLITFHSDPANRAAIEFAVPINDSYASGHRERMAAALATTPIGGTPLYNAMVYSYQRALESYTPGVPNQLIVLTDGDNRDTVDSLTLAQMTEQLQPMIDPNRPINVIVIALGQDADAQAVSQVAQAVRATPIIVPDYASSNAAVARLYLPTSR